LAAQEFGSSPSPRWDPFFEAEIIAAEPLA
jgi:hypothetical protein